MRSFWKYAVFLEKSRKVMELKIRAAPNSRKFGIAGKNGKVIISLKGKPVNNQANSELECKLGELLGCRVTVKKGASSQNKLLLIDCAPDVFESKTGIKLN